MASHGHPFRQVDRAGAPGSAGADRSVAIRAVSAGEVLRDDAIPGVLPPALVVETLAQAALPLAWAGGRGATAGAGPAPRAGEPGDDSSAAAFPGMIVAMDRVRLHRPIRAGDVMKTTAAVTARLGDLIRVECRAEVDGIVVAEGEFTFAAGGPAAARP
jgi:3-hydroxymyristoyl/3-hydroxydecanoyl-(acyl carrier protein) dehydratase